MDAEGDSVGDSNERGIFSKEKKIGGDFKSVWSLAFASGNFFRCFFFHSTFLWQRFITSFGATSDFCRFFSSLFEFQTSLTKRRLDYQATLIIATHGHTQSDTVLQIHGPSGDQHHQRRSWKTVPACGNHWNRELWRSIQGSSLILIPPIHTHTLPVFFSLTTSFIIDNTDDCLLTFTFIG